MDDRTSPPENAWPVTLGEVLEALRSQNTVEVDLGVGGVLVVDWAPPKTSGGDVRSAGHLPPLTDRARRILELVAEGLPAAVVADSLALPIVEVAGELSRLRERYRVESTAAAVEVARVVGDLP